ncbi:MAG: PaaI family thioesterase [Candidatus Lokiarchaeota archaeon]|nr:PaaI family thioesterase [Candidatus Lokiarchaeota archaeon]
MNSLDIIKEQFKRDNFANKFKIVLDDVTETTVKAHMVLDLSSLNLFGRPHGGAIYALADAAFSVIGNNNNNLSVAVESSISYHSSPDPGKTLHVEGRELSGSSKIGHYIFDIYVDDGGKKKSVATMTSVLYKTGKPIREAPKEG